MSHLTELVDALRGFILDSNKGEPALLWAQLSASIGRIRTSCEDAARGAAKADPEKELLRCWDLMNKEAFEQSIRGSERWPVDAARLARHAQAMIATAGAAAAIRRGEAEHFLAWWINPNFSQTSH